MQPLQSLHESAQSSLVSASKNHLKRFKGSKS
ncbi:hypothetical protein V6Z12_D04G046300 [Gossypium hirsutum]